MVIQENAFSTSIVNLEKQSLTAQNRYIKSCATSICRDMYYLGISFVKQYTSPDTTIEIFYCNAECLNGQSQPTQVSDINQKISHKYSRQLRSLILQIISLGSSSMYCKITINPKQGLKEPIINNTFQQRLPDLQEAIYQAGITYLLLYGPNRLIF